jgi:acetamidase/formamidase/AraC-like DNA-binding protein
LPAAALRGHSPTLMLDDLRRFSTDAFPEALRQSALDEVLARALVRSEAASEAKSGPGPGQGVPPLQGHVSSRSSTLDSVFVRLASSPQVLVPDAGTARHSGRAVLLFVLLKGSAVLQEQGACVALNANAAVLLDPAQPWRLGLRTDCRALLVKLESASFLLRLVRTCSPEARRITPAHGLGAMCLTMAESLSEQIDHLGRDDLLSVEATLTDLLVTCLSREVDSPAEPSEPSESSDQPTSVQLSHLRRICRTIEARLGDAELSLESVARVEGLSTRYLQKLFKVGATSFGEYLRERRLERCKLDLANRALNHFTISALCFRWGFGDAANFSRAFTARYGVSPKAYRAQPASQQADALHDQRGRPLKGSEAKSAADPAPARTPHSPFQALLRDHARYAVALALTPKRSAASASAAASASTADGTTPNHYYLPVSDKTVHWGYLSRSLKPVISVRSGDVVTVETLTQHASDDRERMIDGDPGAESVFHWTADKKAVDRRGAGPMDASIFGRGAGEGFGVHICTGPVYVHEAEPGDVLEIRILDVQPRPSCSAAFHGRIFGSNAAAWWGFHYRDQLTEPKQREVVTIYEIDNAVPQAPVARAVYNFRWTPQTDPFGVRHETIDYPGVPVDPETIVKRFGVLQKARVPLRPHFGMLAVAPREAGLVDSIPPGYFGGNLDNWRAGKGSKLFLPVSVPGALFSAGDPHASQGDSELCGTAIECSLTGVFQLVLHKRSQIEGGFLAELNYPFLETETEWVVQGFSFANHLAELGADAQAQIYKKSSLEGAMRDAFNKTRRYLMQAHALDEDEALSLISVAVDFAVTQVVDGNWGVHAVIKKTLFSNDSMD